MSDFEQNQISFGVYLLHRIAEAWGMPVPDAFKLLDSVDAFAGYILPCYDTLHTQGSRALVEDITSFVRGRGVSV